MGLSDAAALADIEENEVMLLYNSLDPESNQIADWYVERYPGVVHCDIAFDYNAFVTPPDCWATKKYISPCRFKMLFMDASGPFAQCLVANPQILCIVTTRGIPAAISNTLTPLTVCGFSSLPVGGIYASLEATLSRYRLGNLFPTEPPTWDPSTAFASVSNPYYVSGSPYQLQHFDDFLTDACDNPVNPICLGDMFIVSRLDAGNPGVDLDGNGVINNLDGVYRLLRQYGNFEVNKYAVTAMADHSTDNGVADSHNDEITGASITMWNDEWCAMLEPTDQFVHGATDPAFDELTDGPFVEWPWIAIETQGYHHQGGEQIFASYAYNYDAHSCGVFLSTESWNGWQIHAGDGVYGTCATLGQAMEWLGPAGGGFAIAYIQEPYGIEINSRTLYTNFFVHNLNWGEAALGSIISIGEMTTVLGDPLARLVVHNPDVNGDRIVNSADYQIVLLAFGTSNPQADINDDGIVNQADINLVREAYGRNCTEPPTEPFPGIGCGDLVAAGGGPGLDGWVSQADLDQFYAIWTALNGMNGPADCPLLDCWAQCPCQGDFNGDAIIDSSDEEIVEANAAGGGTYLFDFDGNGCWDITDSTLFFDYIIQLPESGFICDGEPNCDPLFDVDCDGCVGALDIANVSAHAANPTTPCPS